LTSIVLIYHLFINTIKMWAW